MRSEAGEGLGAAAHKIDQIPLYTIVPRSQYRGHLDEDSRSTIGRDFGFRFAADAANGDSPIQLVIANLRILLDSRGLRRVLMTRSALVAQEQRP